MTFSDFYLHLVLATPYAVITFALIWLAMRVGSDWKLDVGGAKLAMAGVAAILGTTILITLTNGFIYMNSPSTYLKDAILPLDAAGAMIFTAFSIGVSFAACTWMKSNSKQAPSIAA